MNGDFVPWEEAKVHVLTHGLHYGTGVFEGVRCYDTELGPAVFRNAEHVDRLLRSAELYYMPVPYSPGQSNSILDGITRKAVIQIARDLGYAVSERDIGRAELYLADEVFMTGTAAELVPVVEIDDHAIAGSEPGEITRVLGAAFDDAI